MAANTEPRRSRNARASKADDGRRRAVIEGVAPEIDGGRFAIKRVLGDLLEVEADVFTDGHDSVRSRLRHRHEQESDWHEVEMQPLGNDRWRGAFGVDTLGRHRYTIVAWVDRFLTWRRELERREDAADILTAMKVGAQLLESAAARARGSDAKRLREAAAALGAIEAAEHGLEVALDEELAMLAARYPDRSFESVYPRELAVVVDP
ncbi:MAG TPA: maltotransferase domain-containing protein, partial [Gammaproteobacteria bacterium]|nr:maltotransferase domain-containing protein [Gammaproteobacteria bacterium]